MNHGNTLMPAALDSRPELRYDGCDPADHDFILTADRVRRCSRCGYFLQSLIDWWGQDLDVVLRRGAV